MLAITEENSMVEQNDDAFDENGLLKDGRSVRVSMIMRDGLSPLQRAIREESRVSGRAQALREAIEQDAHAITDEFGNDDPLALRRPGPCYLSTRDTACDQERAQAYAVADAEAANAWKGGAQE